MKLLRLAAKGIFSIGEIDLPLSDRGLLLITGFSEDENNSNGAGKSSIANKALIWALYGRTPSGVRADDVINIHLPKSEHYAEVSFIGVDGLPYYVKRQRSPNQLILHSQFQDISARSEKDTQLKIDMALGRDFKTFIHTDFFGHGRKDSFFELPGRDQKELIEDILPMSDLESWADNASRASDKLALMLTDMAQQQKELESNLGLLQSQRITVEQEAESWENARRAKVRELQEKDRTLTQKIQTIEEECETFKLVLDRECSEYSAEKDLETSVQLNAAKTDHEVIKNHLAEMDSEIDKQRECISTLHSLIGKTCPTCSQTISDEELIEKTKNKLDIAEQEYDKIIARRDQCSIDCEKSLSKYHKLELESMDLARQKNLATTLSESIGERILVIKELQNVDWKQEIRDKKAEQNPHQVILDGLITSIKDYRAAFTIADIQIKKLQKDKELVDFWRAAFSKDLKTMLFDYVCPFLEDRTNTYLEQLGNGQIAVQISTLKKLRSGDTRDDFNVTISSRSGGKTFSLLSGGEQQLSSFAMGLALADLAEMQTSGGSEILILDEPFMSLSPENCANVVNFLTQNKRKSTILLISNEDELKSLVPNSIHVVKKNGVSHVN